MKFRCLLLLGFILTLQTNNLLAQSGAAKTRDDSTSQQLQTPPTTPQLREDSANTVKDTEKANNSSEKNESKADNGIEWLQWAGWGSVVVAFLVLLVKIWLNRRKKIRDTAKTQKIGEKDAEIEIFQESSDKLAKKYQDHLKKELGKIHLLGHRDLDNIPLDLSHTFVNLNITETERSEERFLEGRPDFIERHTGEKTADDLLKDIFNREIPLTVIIGEPGAGKTTIEKYFGLSCRNEEKCHEIEIPKDIFPIFLPLRELKFTTDEPEKINHCLARIADKNLLPISADIFLSWLEKKKTMLLLDGLDEIAKPEHRKAACKMIDRLAKRFEDNARIIVTCRGAVYSKEEGVYLNGNPLRADVKDLSLEQQEIFLNNWFYAVNRQETYRDKTITPEQEKALREKSGREAQPLINYLKAPDNKNIRELAGVPLMLQLMAFLWKYRRYKPDNAKGLYQTTLLYILGDRDKERNVPQPLKSDEMMEVLMPVALKMIEIYGQDYLSEADWLKELQPELEKYGDKAPTPDEFLIYLYQRSGLLAKYQDNQFIYKHKSFLEFLAAKQLREQWNYEGRMNRIVSYFGNKSWGNTLRFFMHLSNADVFDKFMEAFFCSEISKDMSQNEQTLLHELITIAPQKRIDGLIMHLADVQMHRKHTYIIDCLKKIDTLLVYKELADLINSESDSFSKETHNYAVEAVLSSTFTTNYYPLVNMVFVEVSKEDQQKIIRKIHEDKKLEIMKEVFEDEQREIMKEIIEDEQRKIMKELFEDEQREIMIEVIEDEQREKIKEILRSKLDKTPKSLRNPQEYNAEYILIPGGSYIYQKGKKELEKQVEVSDFYLAKHPVTHQRYRRFIRYLAGEEADLQTMLPKNAFAEVLQKFAQSDLADDKNFSEYLGNPGEWAKKMRSDYDTEKRFDGEDQPVVRISWFAARSYCLWLSCLEQTQKGSELNMEKAATLYRLPDETEWEWAASGGNRKYPWGDTPEPNEKLANYNSNVGATTPVGRYPEGATPEGLMDMAGNVWEWQENWSPTREGARSLRGGSWDDVVAYLRCSARSNYYPDNRSSINGFRVLRSSF